MHERARRSRWFLITLLLLATLGALYWINLPLRAADKIQAVEILVAWIVEHEPIPGYGEKYPDAGHMDRMDRFIVICDFLPADVALSADPRVRRASATEREDCKNQRCDFIRVKLKSVDASLLIVEFDNTFGHLAAHGYEFEFRRKLWGLRAHGKFLWVA